MQRWQSYAGEKNRPPPIYLEIVQGGTKVLKETIDNIRPTDEEINTKDIYERWLNNNLKMTNKISP